VFTKKLFFAWITSAVVMFSLSYAWHGLLLNDFARITYQLNVFLLLMAITYFIIGLVLAIMCSAIEVRKTPYYKGLMFGAFVGLFIYLIAFVFGVSFYSNPRMEHILLDFGWQMIEQSAGGMACCYVYVYFFQKSRLLKN